MIFAHADEFFTRLDRESPAALWAQNVRENRRRGVIGQTQPLDRAVAGDQRSGAAVTDNCAIGGWGRCAEGVELQVAWRKLVNVRRPHGCGSYG